MDFFKRRLAMFNSKIKILPELGPKGLFSGQPQKNRHKWRLKIN